MATPGHFRVGVERFFSAPSTWLSNPPFEKSFFYVSGLGWELPSILWDHPPEARVPLKWREPPSKTVFDKPKLTAIQKERLDQMIAWSIAHVEDGSEESNLGFLLRPVNLQKYLGFSVQRCAGMSKIPHPLFPSKKKKKGKVEVSTRRTRSKGSSPAPVKETEHSVSSEGGSASPSSFEEDDLAEGPAPQIVEGPIVLGDSSDEDGDDVPLARRSPALKRKVTEPLRCADPSSFPMRRKRGGLSMRILSGPIARRREPKVSTFSSSTRTRSFFQGSFPSWNWRGRYARG
jgi:hypothetical protein